MSFLMEWTSNVDEHHSASAMRVATYLVSDLNIPPIHIVDAMLVGLDIVQRGRYIVLKEFQDINFPIELVATKTLSVPLLLFHLLISKDVAMHYAWFRHLVENMTSAVTHRDYKMCEQAVLVVNEWFVDLTGTACVLSWISDVGRPDMRYVVLCASRTLHLAYWTHTNVQYAIAMAVQGTWILNGEFRLRVSRVIHNAQIPVIAVKETNQVDFLVDTTGLICTQFDKILLLLLLLFSNEENLIDQDCECVPVQITPMIKMLRKTCTKGIEGALPFVKEYTA